jgi:hypothetical protein
MVRHTACRPLCVVPIHAKPESILPVYAGDQLISSRVFGSMHSVVGRYRRSADQSPIVQKKKQKYLNFKVMFSRALLTKLNCLDFLLLKGQSHDKV